MDAPLKLRGDVFPLLEAFAAGGGYGDVTVTFDKGQVKHVEVNVSMRLPDQLRALSKRLLGA